MSQIRGRESDAEFVRRVCIVGGIAALVATLYKLSDVVLLSFGAILVAVVIRALARPIQAETSLSERVALLASGVGILILIGSVGYLFGANVSDQLASLVVSVPAAAQHFSKTFSVTDLVPGSSLGALLMSVFSWGTTIFGAAAELVVVIMAGIYIAVSPEVYRKGFLMLFPRVKTDPNS